MSPPPPIRVVVQQPSLRRYRVPVYRELARRDGIDLQVWYGDAADSGAAEPDGFRGRFWPAKRLPLPRRSLYWHSPQWQGATRAHADVLVLSWDLHYASLLPALLRARANGVGTILWGHGYSRREAIWRRAPRQQLAGLASALLFYNRTIAGRFIENGWGRDRVHVALNSLDQQPIQDARQRWACQPDRLEAFRVAHGIHDGPVVLFVSRLHRDNRVDLLLRAAARLTPTIPTLRLVIVGQGPDLPRLLALARSLGLTDHVRFPGAIYNEMDLAPWFLSSDVFCYPANVGLSLLHAFGYGLPVLTSDHTAAAGPEIEALRDGENGLLFSDGSADALAERLRLVLTDRPLRARLAAGARHTVTERFTLPRMVDGMEAAIRFAHAQRCRDGTTPPSPHDTTQPVDVRNSRA